jgi:hypothetical protein
MTTPDHLGKLPDIPDPVVVQKKRWAPSLVWAIPILAALIGLSLIINMVWIAGQPSRFASRPGKVSRPKRPR